MKTAKTPYNIIKVLLKSLNNLVLGGKEFLTTHCAVFIDTLLPRLTSPSHNFIHELEKINLYRVFSENSYSYINKNRKDIQTYSFFNYKDPIIKKTIWGFKYKLDAKSLEAFSHILFDEVIAHLFDTASLITFSIPTFIVYCPSSSYISGKKHFDQMKELSLYIEKLQNPSQPFFSTCCDAINVLSTKDQHLGTKIERLAWAKNKYKTTNNFRNIIEKFLYSHRFKNDPGLNSDTKTHIDIHIICIDDILTTGATLKAVNTALLASQNYTDNFNIHITNFTLCFTELKIASK